MTLPDLLAALDREIAYQSARHGGESKHLVALFRAARARLAAVSAWTESPPPDPWEARTPDLEYEHGYQAATTIDKAHVRARLDGAE